MCEKLGENLLCEKMSWNSMIEGQFKEDYIPIKSFNLRFRKLLRRG